MALVGAGEVGGEAVEEQEREEGWENVRREA
jgi:hypothetical protein